ncbi:MAG TPA: zf-HC2 domain-containing protein [Blastocatellia bacterium]|nr:zf-HC2 domain-containing protein [Blastocatellia bacterium]
MVCKQCQELISDYIDGTLELGEQVNVERHLADCEPCRAVRDDLLQIVHFSRQLPEYTPSSAVWTRIQADIAEHGPPSLLTRARAWWSGVRSGHSNLSIPQMAAAAAAIVIVISIGVITLRRDGSNSSNSSAVNSESSALETHPLSNPEVQQFEKKINEYSERLEQRKASWPPELRDAFDRNMLTIDQTLMACRHQLKDNPADDVSQELMMNAYMEKLRVLEGFDKF